MIGEKLTPEQQELHDWWLEESRRIGACTDRANRPRAEASIKRLYGWLQKPPPQFVWCGSPASCVLVRDAIELMRYAANATELDDNSRELRSAIVERYHQNVAKPKGPKKPKKKGGGKTAIQDAMLVEAAHEVVTETLPERLAKRNTSRTSPSQSGWYNGQHEQYWIAFYTFCEWIGVKYEKERSSQLAAWRNIARSCGWWLPYEKVCFVSERPTVCARNERHVLHCEDGPAMLFEDGWAIWQIDGLPVDEQIVMRPETQTIAQIEAEASADIKTLRIDRFGWPRYLKETNSECIDERENVIEGTPEALYNSPSGRRLVAVCPTGRVFVMGVVDEVETCEQAQKWIHHGIDVVSRT